jgi:hypothetical protein
MKRFFRLYVANTEFELELMRNEPMKPFSFHHPISIQLQCLPFLFAGPEDGVVVKGELPDRYFEHLIELGLPDFSDKTVSPDDEFECETVHSWGMSRGLAAWAREKGLAYEMPDWEIVREVNSKLFSYNQLPGFENSLLIGDEQGLAGWMKNLSGKGVLKTAFGFSGKGKVILDDTLPFDKILAFCKKEWSRKRPVIAGPWLHKELDFSTHWVIGREETVFLGATRLFNDPFGAYRGSAAGPQVEIPFLSEHFPIAEKALEAMREKGYFGPVGIDAMVYGGGRLHPLVEINARQTMSLSALRFQQRRFPEKNLRFDFISQGQDKNWLIPKKITNFDEKEIKFNKQFQFGFIS